MATTLLRTLTEKSKLGYGKHGDLTIQSLLNTNQHHYLRWMYFNSSNVTFIEPVLVEIGITEQYRIQKPGKYSEGLDLLNKYHSEAEKEKNKTETPAQKHERIVKIQGAKKLHRVMSRVLRQSGKYTGTCAFNITQKAKDARRNHGHK